MSDWSERRLEGRAAAREPARLEGRAAAPAPARLEGRAAAPAPARREHRAATAAPARLEGRAAAPAPARREHRAATAAPATRREALQLIGAALLVPGMFPWTGARAAENLQLAFGSGSLEGALQALGVALDPSPKVRLAVPDFVDNGAVVPVEVTSELAGAQTIFVFSEANPFPLVARFSIPEGTDPYVSTRIKVAESCNVYALVQAEGRCFSAVKHTTVTVGGCGNG
jgi:sulfur-oxidizing protein SoxY